MHRNCNLVECIDKVHYSIKHGFNPMEFIKNIVYKLKPNSFEGYVQNFRL
jgi:hypothetical protein